MFEERFYLTEDSSYLPIVSYALCDVIDGELDLFGTPYPFDPEVSEEAYNKLVKCSYTGYMN